MTYATLFPGSSTTFVPCGMKSFGRHTREGLTVIPSLFSGRSAIFMPLYMKVPMHPLLHFLLLRHMARAVYGTHRLIHHATSALEPPPVHSFAAPSAAVPQTDPTSRHMSNVMGQNVPRISAPHGSTTVPLPAEPSSTDLLYAPHPFIRVTTSLRPVSVESQALSITSLDINAAHQTEDNAHTLRARFWPTPSHDWNLLGALRHTEAKN